MPRYARSSPVIASCSPGTWNVAPVRTVPSICLTVSNCSGVDVCVRSPVCMTNAGREGRALICWMDRSNVPVTSWLAAPLKPMWLSLIWTKYRSFVLGPAACWPPPPIPHPLSRPPVTVQATPVPAQAMHLRKPRRSISGSMVFPLRSPGGDHDRPMHVGMDRADVRVGARLAERVRVGVAVLQRPGGRGAGDGHRVRVLVLVRPGHGRTTPDGDDRRAEGEVRDVDRRGRHRAGRRRGRGGRGGCGWSRGCLRRGGRRLAAAAAGGERE